MSVAVSTEGECPVCASPVVGSALCHTCLVIVVRTFDTMGIAVRLAHDSLQIIGAGRRRVEWTEWITYMRERLDECGGSEDLLSIRDWEECRVEAQGTRWRMVWAPRTMFVRRRFVCERCRLAEVDTDMGLQDRCVDCWLDGGWLFADAAQQDDANDDGDGARHGGVEVVGGEVVGR